MSGSAITTTSPAKTDQAPDRRARSHGQGLPGVTSPEARALPRERTPRLDSTVGSFPRYGAYTTDTIWTYAEGGQEETAMAETGRVAYP